MIIIAPLPPPVTAAEQEAATLRRWKGLTTKVLTFRHIQATWHAWGNFLNRDVNDFVRKRLSEIWLRKPRLQQ